MIDEALIKDMAVRLGQLEAEAVRLRRTSAGGNKLIRQGTAIALPSGPGGAETDPIASAALVTHEAKTTGVHGVSNTADLPRLSALNTYTQKQTISAGGLALALTSATAAIEFGGDRRLARIASGLLGAAALRVTDASGSLSHLEALRIVASTYLEAHLGTDNRVTVGYDPDTVAAGARIAFGSALDASIGRASANEISTGTNEKLSSYGIALRGQRATGAADGLVSDDLSTVGQSILNALIDVKGDLIVGSADNTPARLAPGAADGHVLTRDSAESLGVKWAAIPGAGGSTDHGWVTSLPGSPASGDTCVLTDSLTAPTWWLELRYVSGLASHKWIVTGGTPLWSEITTAETSASTSYTNLSTTGPSITAAVGMIAAIELGAALGLFSGTNQTVRMSYSNDGSTPTDADAVLASLPASTSASSPMRPRQTVTIAATKALVAKYKTSGGTGIWSNRWMRLWPRRVG